MIDKNNNTSEHLLEQLIRSKLATHQIEPSDKVCIGDEFLFEHLVRLKLDGHSIDIDSQQVPLYSFEQIIQKKMDQHQVNPQLPFFEQLIQAKFENHEVSPSKNFDDQFDAPFLKLIRKKLQLHQLEVNEFEHLVSSKLVSHGLGLPENSWQKLENDYSFKLLVQDKLLPHSITPPRFSFLGLNKNNKEKPIGVIYFFTAVAASFLVFVAGMHYFNNQEPDNNLAILAQPIDQVQNKITLENNNDITTILPEKVLKDKVQNKSEKLIAKTLPSQHPSIPKSSAQNVIPNKDEQEHVADIGQDTQTLVPEEHNSLFTTEGNVQLAALPSIDDRSEHSTSINYSDTDSTEYSNRTLPLDFTAEFDTHSTEDASSKLAVNLQHTLMLDSLLAMSNNDQQLLLIKKSDTKAWLLTASIGATGKSDQKQAVQSTAKPISKVASLSKVPVFDINRAEERINVDHQVPLSFGLSVRHNLNKHWAIESGLVYTYLRSSWDNILQPMSLLKNKTQQNLHYLGIPFDLVYYIVNKEKWNIYVSSGATIEKGISQTMEGVNMLNPSSLDGFQWSVAANTGVSYKFYKDFSLYGSPSLAYYFDSDSQPYSIRKDTPLHFQIQAGLRFEW